MTNEQFNAVLKLILQILTDDNVSENTIKKIENLLNKNSIFRKSKLQGDSL